MSLLCLDCWKEKKIEGREVYVGFNYVAESDPAYGSEEVGLITFDKEQIENWVKQDPSGRHADVWVIGEEDSEQEDKIISFKSR